MEDQRAQVKRSLADHGMTIREWANARGFSEALVYAVLNGRNQATRGESYRIACELGLRTRPPMDEAPGYIKDVLQSAALGDAWAHRQADELKKVRRGEPMT